MPVYTKACKICGDQFVTQYKRQIYCSDYCCHVKYSRFIKRKTGLSIDKKYRMRNPIKTKIKAIRNRAIKKGLEFNLTVDWFIAHFSQGCEMTGHDLDVSKGSPWSVEVDRIKPGGNYTMDNCRLVCAIYNLAKLNWSDKDVFEMCGLVVNSPIYKRGL